MTGRVEFGGKGVDVSSYEEQAQEDEEIHCGFVGGMLAEVESFVFVLFSVWLYGDIVSLGGEERVVGVRGRLDRKEGVTK
jgi:hypothetical protein